MIGKLSEGAVFLLFLPHPPDRSPVCCSHPTPEPRGMFTALEDTRGGEPKVAEASAGGCFGVQAEGGVWHLQPSRQALSIQLRG